MKDLTDNDMFGIFLSPLVKAGRKSKDAQWDKLMEEGREHISKMTGKPCDNLTLQIWLNGYLRGKGAALSNLDEVIG